MTAIAQGRRGTATTIAIGIIAAATVLGLLISAGVFLALAITLELAIPIVEHYAGEISAGDVAVAGRLAGYWWIFGGIAVTTFLAAAAVAVQAVRHLTGEREPR